MSTAETELAGLDPQVLADLDAVMKRISGGAAVDPDTSAGSRSAPAASRRRSAAAAASWTTTGSRRCFMTMIYLRQIQGLVAPAVFIDEAAGALIPPSRIRMRP